MLRQVFVSSTRGALFRVYQPCSTAVLTRSFCKHQAPETNTSQRPVQSRGGFPGLTRHADMDILQESIVRTRSLDGLLKLISDHHTGMEERHVTLVLDIFTNQAKGDQSKAASIVSTKEFSLLCKRILRVLPDIEPRHLLNVLYGLRTLNVPFDVLIFQSVLQMIRKRINELSISEILSLDYILNLIDKSTLTEAISIALPIVLETKITSKELDLSPRHVVSAIAFACKHKLQPVALNILISYAKTVEDQLSIDNRISLALYLSKVDISKETELDKVALMEFVARSLHIVSSTSINQLQSKLLTEMFFKRLSKSAWRPYLSVDFLVKVTQEHLSRIRDQNLFEIKRFCRGLQRHWFFDGDYYDAVADRILEEAEEVSEDPVQWLNFFTLPSEWTPPSGWKMVTDALIKTEVIQNLNSLDLLELMYELALIDQFPYGVFSQLDRFSNREAMISSRHRLLTTNAAISLTSSLGEEDRHHFLKTLRELVDFNIKEHNEGLIEEINESQLSKCLVRGFGGEDFVKTGLWTNEGIFLDHVIVMRKGDYPIAIGKSTSSYGQHVNMLEDLRIPEESKVVAVVELSSQRGHYLRHPRILTRYKHVQLQLMRKRGLYVVPIDMDKLISMSPSDQIPSVMKEIMKCISSGNQ